MKMVEQWWKTWSAQLLVLCVFVAELAQYLPEVREALPEQWYRVAFLVILAARIVKQQTEKQ